METREQALSGILLQSQYPIISEESSWQLPLSLVWPMALRKDSEKGCEDGNHLVPWLLRPPPCFFLKLISRKAGGSLSRTSKFCLLSILGTNRECNCSLLVHFQSPKWKGSLPACRLAFAANLPNQCSDPQL